MKTLSNLFLEGLNGYLKTDTGNINLLGRTANLVDTNNHVDIKQFEMTTEIAKQEKIVINEDHLKNGDPSTHSRCHMVEENDVCGSMSSDAPKNLE